MTKRTVDITYDGYNYRVVYMLQVIEGETVCGQAVESNCSDAVRLATDRALEAREAYAKSRFPSTP